MKTNDLSLRLFFESQYWATSYFCTFTYSDEYLPISSISGLPTLRQKDFQNFMKRLRKRINCKCKVFYCGEYGGRTNRPHYHAILFGVPEETLQMLDNIWKNGFVTTSPLTFARCRYCAKYMLKNEVFDYDFCFNHGIEPQFICSSNRPGLGYQYILDNHMTLLRNFYIRYKGIKFAMPRYFYKKLKEIDEFYLQKLNNSLMQRYLRELKDNRLEFKYKTMEKLMSINNQRELNLKSKLNLKGL